MRHLKTVEIAGHTVLFEYSRYRYVNVTITRTVRSNTTFVRSPSPDAVYRFEGVNTGILSDQEIFDYYAVVFAEKVFLGQTSRPGRRLGVSPTVERQIFGGIADQVGDPGAAALIRWFASDGETAPGVHWLSGLNGHAEEQQRMSGVMVVSEGDVRAGWFETNRVEWMTDGGGTSIYFPEASRHDTSDPEALAGMVERLPFTVSAEDLRELLDEVAAREVVADVKFRLTISC